MIEDAVIEKVVCGIPVSVPIDAALQVGELSEIKLEYRCHVVVEFQIEWWNVHGHNCPFYSFGKSFQQAFDETEIRNRVGVVIFHAVRIQTDEKSLSGDKVEIGGPEDVFIYIFSCTQTIVVPQQRDPWNIEA